jgi:hypothetical protein
MSLSFADKCHIALTADYPIAASIVNTFDGAKDCPMCPKNCCMQYVHENLLLMKKAIEAEDQDEVERINQGFKEIYNSEGSLGLGMRIVHSHELEKRGLVFGRD